MVSVAVCWSVLECVGVHVLLTILYGPYCSVLECVGVYWSVLECVGSVLECVGVCRCLGCVGVRVFCVISCGLYSSVLAVCWRMLECVGVYWSVLECVGVCVGVCWSVLECVAHKIKWSLFEYAFKKLQESAQHLPGLFYSFALYLFVIVILELTSHGHRIEGDASVLLCVAVCCSVCFATTCCSVLQ